MNVALVFCKEVTLKASLGSRSLFFKRSAINILNEYR